MFLRTNHILTGVLGKIKECVRPEHGAERTLTPTAFVSLTADGLWHSGNFGPTWQWEDERLPCDKAVDVALGGQVVYMLLG